MTTFNYGLVSARFTFWAAMRRWFWPLPLLGFLLLLLQRVWSVLSLLRRRCLILLLLLTRTPRLVWVSQSHLRVWRQQVALWLELRRWLVEPLFWLRVVSLLASTPEPRRPPRHCHCHCPLLQTRIPQAWPQLWQLIFTRHANINARKHLQSHAHGDNPK